jgi:hypothetical protein
MKHIMGGMWVGLRGAEQAVCGTFDCTEWILICGQLQVQEAT